MKHIELYESFVKSYGGKYSPEDFAKVAVGTEILYKGGRYTVDSNNGVTMSIKDKRGGVPIMLNLAMFNHGAAIPNNESLLEKVEMIGNIKVEKMQGGWKLSTDSAMGRGTQVVVLTDADVEDFIKIVKK